MSWLSVVLRDLLTPGEGTTTELYLAYLTGDERKLMMFGSTAAAGTE
jgi:hypothetical protein